MPRSVVARLLRFMALWQSEIFLRNDIQMKAILASTFFLIAQTSQVFAADLTFGLGSANIGESSSRSTAFQIEYHSDPIWEFQRGSISAAAALQVEGNSTHYAGVGLSTRWSISEKWFVEGSLLAGHYDTGSNGVDLGGNFQFRTLAGLGYKLRNKTYISIAVDHLSNAGLERSNPGRESISIRYGFSF